MTAMTSMSPFVRKKGRGRYLMIFVGVFILIGLYVLYTRHEQKGAYTAYAAYADLAQTQEDAAYLPAAPNNPVRQQLNLVLAETLQSGVSSPQRLADASLGLSLISQLDAQIDDIGSTSDAANAALAKLQVGLPGSLGTNATLREIVSLAKQRSALIEDVRGLSYRADFETRQIFERIIADKGALTSAHIEDLNSEVPQVESEFDRRTSIYGQIESLSAQIQQKATTLGGS